MCAWAEASFSELYPHHVAHHRRLYKPAATQYPIIIHKKHRREVAFVLVQPIIIRPCAYKISQAQKPWKEDKSIYPVSHDILSLHPVLNIQPLHARKLARIVGHQNTALGNAVPRNTDIVVSYELPLACKLLVNNAARINGCLVVR